MTFMLICKLDGCSLQVCEAVLMARWWLFVVEKVIYGIQESEKTILLLT